MPNNYRDELSFEFYIIFYNNICACLIKATADLIPTRNHRITEFNIIPGFTILTIPGCNTYVAEMHDAARETFMVWMDCGKPRFGQYYDKMQRTRALFKLDR